MVRINYEGQEMAYLLHFVKDQDTFPFLGWLL